MGGGAMGRKQCIDLPVGSTVKDLKQYTRCLHPYTTISRVLFGGKVLSDDTKALAEYGVYKECTVQLMLKKVQSESEKMDQSMIKMIRERRLKRAHTEDDIQFGDAIVLRLIQARNLMQFDNNTNPYTVLQYDGQIQRGAVRKHTNNPVYNETFGFFVEMLTGSPKTEAIQIGIYHHDFDTQQDKPMGTFQLKVDDLPRNKQVDHFCKLDSGSGEVFLSIRRAPIVSPELAITLKKIIAIQTPWTKQMLQKHQVSLYHFLGSQPWKLTDEDTSNGANSVLSYLLESVNSNKINLQNYRNVNKVATMLHSQRAVTTDDAPCPTLYFSDIAATEKDLFDYLSQIVPNGVKSIYYNIPRVSMNDIKSELSTLNLDANAANLQRQAYACIQFKNTSTAIKALLNMATCDDPKFHHLASFGPPKECDDAGVIGSGSRSLIEGFLQVNIPKDLLKEFRKMNNDGSAGADGGDAEAEEKGNDGGDGGDGGVDNDANGVDEEQDEIGEAFYINDDNEEFPYFWCKIADDTFQAYHKMHGNSPFFTLSIGELTVRPSGPWTFDLIRSEDSQIFSIRSTNQSLLTLWRMIILKLKDGDLSDGAQSFRDKVELRKQNVGGVWYCHQCYLSKKTLPIFLLYSPDGHKWFADRKMLNQYVRSCLQRGQLDQISTRFTVSDLKDILSAELFDEFAAKQLEMLIETKSHYVKCPSCSMAMEILSPSKKISAEEATAIKKLRHPSSSELLDADRQQHYRQYRILCRNASCNKDFCRHCWEQPYHLGETCESLKSSRSAAKCRFCRTVLTESNRVQNPVSKALANVCTNKPCFEKMKVSSDKVLSCGHLCLGVRNEPTDCPCLFPECPERSEQVNATTTDYCDICKSETLEDAPCVVMPCNHVFHYQCVRKKIDIGWPKAYISFEFSYCPTCRTPMEHPKLGDIVDPLRSLEMILKEKGLKRLKYEGRDKDDPVVKPDGHYYNDPVNYAAHIYAYFMCHECKEPYFGGAKECGDDSQEEVKKEDLICGKCQKIDSVDECKEHGEEYLAYKCRYCCTMSVFHCWGKVHFCRNCHQPGVWDKLSTYSTGKNKKALEDYPQCDGLRQQINALMKNPMWHKWSRERKDEEIYKLRALPELCPLECKHPPNGFEFGLGCTLCADKKTEIENKKARLKVEKENRMRLAKIMPFMDEVPSGTKFVHKHPLDENGILYFFGTKGTRDKNQYVNPAKQGMVIVNTSEMMPDSQPYSAFIGRQCVRCVTKPSASCWFSVDFIDKYIKPSHYTLRHYISWDTECLRNWVIEGSIDGERWLVLRQHQNDQALNYKGQAYTWALHDYGCAFRRLRVKQTGPNNNNHYFLACSGFEVYGTLYKEDNTDIEGNFAKAFNEQQKMKQLSLVRFWQMLSAGQAGVYHFTYSEDFDENGILYFLGAQGNQQAWKNPALTDEVAVCSSALVKDSSEISYFVGRSTVRLVTKPEDNAWMQVDFKDKLIQPSYYTLKHYISWDTECLRNWILQASNDGIHWVTVKKHEEDGALSEKGGTHTWPVQSRGAYRIWRIKQTGLNSNKHKYLACSGIEFYGQLFLTKFDPLAGVSNRPACEKMMQSLKFLHKCTYQQNNDKNGVIYYIGTRGGRSNWVNPGARKWVLCDASSLMRDSTPAYSLCGRISVRCVTQPLENSWMKIDLKNFYVVPTHYALRHYISWDTEALRNWILEASFDGHSWQTLRAHRNDSALNHKGAVATWELRAKGAKYRCFRIRQIGVNSNKHYYLSCSGFEIYGDIYQIASANPQKMSISNPPSTGESPNASNNDAFDPSLTGQVPWDNEPVQGGPGANPAVSPGDAGGAGATTAGGDVGADEESQDMALLREMARQEKQRLIHHLSAGNGYPFYYTKDFDECGILHFLGTDWRTAPWRNPAEMGVATVTSSRLGKDSEPATAICGRKVVRCVCMAEKNNWFMIDFRNLYVRVTHYSLRHYDSWDTECLRNWYLEGSNDLKKFKIIKEHKKDKSLFGKGSTHTWQVDTKGKRYRAFRIRQFGHNSNKHWYLACAGLEFYGEIYFKPR